MPNWTSNILNVVGKPEAVDKFVAHMGEVMDFEKVIPPPENMFRDNLSSEDRSVSRRMESRTGTIGSLQIGGPNGTPHLMRVRSKWKSTKSMNMKQATYRFETAWDTPREVITALWDKWPDLDFEGGYIHEGYEGCGSFSEFNNRE